MPRAKVKGQRAKVGFLAIVAAAALQWFIGSPLAAQSSQPRSLPIFEVDRAWPKVPAKWKLGDRVELRHRRAGQRLAPASSAHAQARAGRDGGAAGDGVRHRRAISSRRGAAPATATSGPSASTASTSTAKGFVWLSGNNCPTNGIRGLKPVADDQLLKFTQDGKFVMQIGHSNQSKGNADTQNVHRAADVVGASADQRGVRRRRLRQSPRHRVRCRHRRVQADVGRVRQQAGGRRPLRGGHAEELLDGSGPAQLQHRPRASAWRRTAWSMWPIARTGACSRSRPTASS